MEDTKHVIECYNTVYAALELAAKAGAFNLDQAKAVHEAAAVLKSHFEDLHQKSIKPKEGE